MGMVWAICFATGAFAASRSSPYGSSRFPLQSPIAEEA